LCREKGSYRRVYNEAEIDEASLLSQKGNFMKTIFNNKGKFTLYSLFTVAILSFIVFLLFPILLHVDLPSLIGICALVGIIYFGGIVLQMRSGPPW
jgi:hypothetical protein